MIIYNHERHTVSTDQQSAKDVGTERADDPLLGKGIGRGFICRIQHKHLL